MVLVVGVPSSVVPPSGRTTTSPTDEAKIASKERLRVSVKIREPATKATPSTIAKVLISRRSLRPSRLFQAALNISAAAAVRPGARRAARASMRVIRSSTVSRSGSRSSSTTLPSARNTTRSV